MQVSGRCFFDLVHYADTTGVRAWSPKPRIGSWANKYAAIAWLNDSTSSLDNCMDDAMLETIRIASDCRRPARKMIFVSNWSPACSAFDEAQDSGYATATLLAVTAANDERIPIDTVLVPTVSWYEDDFWVELAAANRGTYTLVEEFELD